MGIVFETLGFSSARGHHYLNVIGSGSGFNVLDVGANRGEFSREISSRYDGGNYYLIEANPKLVGHIKACEERVEVWNQAVAGSNGVVELNVARNDEASSVLELPNESQYGAEKMQTVQVEKVTLGSVIENTGAEVIDLLKMDIEGAEVEALGSLTKEEARRIAQISVEFHSDPRFGFQLQERTEEVIQHLSSLGFFPLDFSRPHKMDILFLNRRHFDVSALKAAVWKLGVEVLPYFIHRILYYGGLHSKNRR